MKIEFDLNEDPGRGNLNLRAYFAATVGRKRLAHAVRKVIVVPSRRAVLLARNQVGGRGPQCMYVNCNIPERRDEEGFLISFANFRFSGGNDAGDNAVYRILQPIGSEFASYEEVLLPGEELYGQFARSDNLGDSDLLEFPLVVSTVSF